MPVQIPFPSAATPHERLLGPLPQLKPADIIVIRHKKDLFRKFLRMVTESYWDHTAMVIYPSDPNQYREHTIFIESIRKWAFSPSSRGITFHRIQRYLNRPDLYEIGVKRVPNLTDTVRERVVLFMLMNVDAPYWPWKRLRIIFAAFFKPLRQNVLAIQRFSCSSLIQKAFYDAVNWEEKNKVVFKNAVWSPIELTELTSPADVAASANSEWVYNKK